RGVEGRRIRGGIDQPVELDAGAVVLSFRGAGERVQLADVPREPRRGAAAHKPAVDRRLDEVPADPGTDRRVRLELLERPLEVLVAGELVAGRGGLEAV